MLETSTTYEPLGRNGVSASQSGENDTIARPVHATVPCDAHCKHTRVSDQCRPDLDSITHHAYVSVSSAATNAHFPTALKSPAVIICRSGCCCRTSAFHGSVSVALEKLLDPAAILFVFGDQ